MVGEEAEAGAIEDDRAADIGLGRFQLTDDLVDGGQRVLVFQHALEVMAHCLEQMDQRPGGAACLIEDIVDLEPRRLDLFFRLGTLGRGGALVAGQAQVELRLADTGRQALGQGTEAILDIRQPGHQVVGTRVELAVVLGVIAQTLEVVIQPLTVRLS